MNSLTQHFVGVDYLLAVIEAAVARLTPGGRLFIGDVTAANTRDLYFASVAAHRAGPQRSGADVLRDLALARMNERELVFDPWFFQRLPLQLPGIADVEVQLKAGAYDNELINFRFDVCIQARGGDSATTLMRGAVRDVHWRDVDPADWPRQVLAAARGAETATVWLQGVPNARLQPAAGLLRTLQAQPQVLMSQLRSGSESASLALTPQQLWDLHEQLPQHSIRLLFSSEVGCMDALLVPAELVADANAPLAAQHAPRSAASYASRPLNQSLFAKVCGRLRELMQGGFPDYLHPAKYVALAELPRTASGKVDRRALPAPSTERPDLDTPFVAPKGEKETKACELWQRFLELDQVGVNDNFFDLGGNSVLSLRLVAAMSEAFEQPIPIVALFQHPTVRGLCAALDTGNSAAAAETKLDTRARASKAQAAFAANRKARSRRG